MGITLPVEKSKPKYDLKSIRFHFYGKPKVGKTSLALQFEDALLLAFEPGAETQEAFQVPIKNWTQFIELKAEIKKSNRFKTLIFDTADMAFDYCVRNVCQKLGVEERSDAGWGKGWNAVRTEFTKHIMELAHTGRGLIFISHQGVEPYKDIFGKDKQRIVPSLRDKGARVLDAIVDVWAPILLVEGKRILKLRGSESIDAGHRLSRTAFQRFNELEEVDLGKSPEEAYKALVSALYPPVKELKQ